MLVAPKSPPVSVLSICELCSVDVVNAFIESVSRTVSTMMGDSPIIK